MPSKQVESSESGTKAAFAGYTCLFRHVRDEAVEAENVEHAGEVVAERHQAPFASNLVEAADEEVLIAGAAFERPEGELDDGGAPAHQFTCAFACHPVAMTVENIFVPPAADAPAFCLRRKTRSL